MLAFSDANQVHERGYDQYDDNDDGDNELVVKSFQSIGRDR